MGRRKRKRRGEKKEWKLDKNQKIKKQSHWMGERERGWVRKRIKIKQETKGNIKEKQKRCFSLKIEEILGNPIKLVREIEKI